VHAIVNRALLRSTRITERGAVSSLSRLAVPAAPLALLTLTILTAVPRSGVAFAQTPGTGVISGNVVEASNNNPIRKAIVTLTWQGTPRSWATSRTDSSGQFKFEGLPPGKYDLRATKPGEGTAIYGATSVRELGELITLDDGETRAGARLRFLRSATISGRVLDPHGDPAIAVSVTLLKADRYLGERVLVPYGGASTNDRGEYQLDDIVPGQYYLHAEQPYGWRMTEPLVQQFLGGARESKDSTILNIKGGENLTGVDFHMTSEPAVPVHGRVTGVPNTGHNAEAVKITLWQADEYVQNYVGIPDTPKAPDYAFSFDLTPGRYRIDASAQIDGKDWTATQLVDTRRASDDVILALAAARDVKGRLRVEGLGAPSAGSFNIRLSHTGLGSRISAPVAADGTFTLAQVSPGDDWVIRVNPLPPGAFLKVARFGDQDIRFARMQITPGSEDTVSIVISMNTAQVHGEVDASGGDSRRAGILLAPTGPYSTLIRFYYVATTDDSGKFELKDIAPGKYKIFALQKLEPAEFRTPEAASQLDPLGVEIELAEGARLEVHPKLIPVERAREALP
jgi:protocatechuate 3,4-dioxygenase beta subunit